jgi:hypothetical protein
MKVYLVSEMYEYPHASFSSESKALAYVNAELDALEAKYVAEFNDNNFNRNRYTIEEMDVM